MPVVQNILPLISAFGMGAIVTALVQAWLLKKAELLKRNFQEKKECYVGLLEAYHRAAIENTNEAAKNFGYWQMRCDLVAPQEVRKAIQEIINTNENKEARNVAHENLKRALRKDLGVTDN
jgi:hypothetical protein